MRRTFLLLVVVATAILMASGVALAIPSSTPDPGTAQTDGRVRTVLTTNDTVYLGGTFTQVTDTDGTVVARNNLAAIDADTGRVTGWNPDANGPVEALAASADGSRIYAGGEFTAVGGAARSRLAAVDAAAGAVDPAWAPVANDAVRAIAVLDNRVYVGGHFTAVDGRSRGRLAQINGVTGDLNLNWAPRTNNAVRALALSTTGSRLYVGGGFTALDGQPRPYLAAVSTTTGALETSFRPPTPNGRIWDIERANGRVYTAEGGPNGGRAAAYGPTNTRYFNHRTAGDTQAVAVSGGTAYYGGHFERIRREPCEALIAVDARTGAINRNWKPVIFPRYLGVWALTADASRSRLYVGGDFTRVSGVTHQHFARFSD